MRRHQRQPLSHLDVIHADHPPIIRRSTGDQQNRQSRRPFKQSRRRPG
jgi:hypothetical protein